MHLEEEIKPPPLRGENVHPKSPKKLPPGTHVSHHAELPTSNWESKFTREALLKEVTEQDWRGALHRDRTVSQAVIAKAVPEDVRGEFEEEGREERKKKMIEERKREARRRKQEEKIMERKLKESQSRLRSKTGELEKGYKVEGGTGWK